MSSEVSWPNDSQTCNSEIAAVREYGQYNGICTGKWCSVVDVIGNLASAYL